MATHTAIRDTKIYLRHDLSGGDRGILKKGTAVTVTNTTQYTSYIAEPSKGWVSSADLEKIPEPEPPPEPEPEPLKKYMRLSDDGINWTDYERID